MLALYLALGPIKHAAYCGWQIKLSCLSYICVSDKPRLTKISIGGALRLLWCSDHALDLQLERGLQGRTLHFDLTAMLCMSQSSHGEDTKYYDIGDRRRSPPRYERSILERLHKVCPALLSLASSLDFS